MWNRLSVVRAPRALEPGEFAPPINTSVYERFFPNYLLLATA